MLIGLMLYGLIVDLGGAQNKDGRHIRIGFDYWKPPYGPMGHANLHASGNANIFLGWWAVMGTTVVRLPMDSNFNNSSDLVCVYGDGSGQSDLHTITAS
jgi:hypothetical protein